MEKFYLFIKFYFLRDKSMYGGMVLMFLKVSNVCVWFEINYKF